MWRSGLPWPLPRADQGPRVRPMPRHQAPGPTVPASGSLDLAQGLGAPWGTLTLSGVTVSPPIKGNVRVIEHLRSWDEKRQGS